ncbi:transposase [Marinomonas sp. 15G1-11]|uniref:Transposase n=1 Tax=Marinomonas phaeophyticola TaxID=3004091 RepID=A0ABT4JP97_9GAMM|nr:transposase [Marinomonas sp. 15G1-11]MCZ2720185.1 transposase [Marinomonas sp. 15G1-11]
MPRARSQQVSLSDTPYYHCISRCVRRAFLCGEDSLTGKSFEHRRGWIEARILFLAEVFSIDICAYAVMSNHLHIVLHVDEKQTKNWSTHEVLRRWHSLHKGTLFTQQYAHGDIMPAYAIELAERSAEAYRERLSDISWFMRELNEPIARQANAEDECTGRFWEGRFKSQALLDEASVLACMAYVDLNPIRANIAATPETSDFTSIKKRVEYAKEITQSKALYPFIGNEHKDKNEGILFKLTDYLQLVDMTGRIARQDKRGSIDLSLSPILQRLGVTSENWLTIAINFEQNTHGVVGQENSITRYKNAQPRSRPNKRCCHLLA